MDQMEMAENQPVEKETIVEASKEIDFSKIFKTAKRSSVPLKIMMSGPSGGGKTMSSLKLAYGLTKNWEKIVVIDTEDSASLYANHRQEIGSFKVFNMKPPYNPERLVKGLEMCEKAGFEAVIIDSMTHFWSGQGGMLEIHESFGGKFQDWQKSNPIYREMLEAIKQSKLHVIGTARKKTDYAITNENGRTKVEKLGLADEVRNGMEYEFTIAFDINIHHMASTSKDRTGLFMDRVPFLITKETGEELLKWSKGEEQEAKI